MCKGDNPRTWNTPEFEANYERIFGKKEPYYARKKSEGAKTCSDDASLSTGASSQAEQQAVAVSSTSVPTDEKGVAQQ